MSGRILSGVQPTGNLHLGNYLGAIRNWVALQEEFECIYSIVDLHALTIPGDPKELQQNVLETAAAFIACGVDPKRSVIFAQSAVPGHTQLSWIFSTLTPMGWLNRMTQFKEKAGKKKDMANLGLYAYPVLMASDILIYRATHVPVGEDQKQHLELCRDIAGAFNQRFGVEYFTLPEPQILGDATRVMSLRDGTKKMSKSDASDFSRITLRDDADAIALKIRKAKTDPEPLPSDAKGLEGRPEAENLVTLYASLSSQSVEEALKDVGGQEFSKFKEHLTEVMVAKISPITAEMNRLMADQGYLRDTLDSGNQAADALASQTVREVYEIMGLTTPAETS